MRGKMAAPTYVLLTGVICSILALNIADEGGDPRSGTISQVSDIELNALTETEEHVLAFFYNNDCVTLECMNAEEEVELTQKHSTLNRLKVVKLADEIKAKEYGIDVFPNLVFFHNGSPNLYPDEVIDVESCLEWIEGARDEVIRVLDDATFEHTTQAASGATTGDWLIMFYQPRCSNSLATFRAVANKLKHRVVVGRVDSSKNGGLVRRFKIMKCPTIKFFRHGNMYDFTLPKSDVATLVNFAEGWYKNSRAQAVPPEQTPFDNLVESIVLSLKENVNEGYTVYIFVAVFVILLLVAFLVMRMGTREKKE